MLLNFQGKNMRVKNESRFFLIIKLSVLLALLSILLLGGNTQKISQGERLKEGLRSKKKRVKQPD